MNKYKLILLAAIVCLSTAAGLCAYAVNTTGDQAVLIGIAWFLGVGSVGTGIWALAEMDC